MDAQEKRAAATHASRASKQARHAAKNSAKAVKVVAEDVAEDAHDKLEDVADATVNTVKKFSPRGSAMLSGNTAQGLVALTVAALAVGFATKKIQGVFKTRNRIIDSAVKADHTIRPDGPITP